jgi:hypothetical protein
MTTVTDPKTGVTARVAECKSCHQAIYWGYTAAGKRCPYDVSAEGEPTTSSHFASCPHAKQWTKR